MTQKCFTYSLIFLTCLGTYAQSIIGFAPENAGAQLELESQFESRLKAENLDSWMQRLAAEPHWVGTEYGKENAEWMAEQFKSWGYETQIETYHILFPYPKVRELDLLAPDPYKAKLTAVPVEGDPYTAQGEALLPSYNAFSTDGEVEADLVFVNYGIPSDYEELDKLGIDVKGKIVIAKYYGSWRGIKPKLAAEKGAIGCIIYSDPEDDGYVRGDVYPEGAFKNKTGVQRGSVMDMPLYPGDVLTPGYAAKKDAKRLDRKEAPTITRIPVLPISYEDALPLLSALKGPVAPNSWKGGLPITYHIGPGPAKVRIKLEFDWKLVPAHNVIAKLRGSTYPDQWIMRGNHHDAWVHGANDPVSGMVAVMEEARVIGELAKQGKRPKRTVVYAAWDAEEPGLIGSTEWVEDHEKELQSKLVAYINTDSNGRGFFGAGGSHTLQAMVSEVADAVKDPQTGVSIRERRIARQLTGGGSDRFELSALGSGSDYTPFIQHAGIASLNIGFGGENAGGEYHTIYDTYPHYTRFKDPGFAYGVTLANTAGRIVLRMANADVLPFEFRQWHSTVEGYLKEIMDDMDSKRKSVQRHNELVEKKAYALAADPRENIAPPRKKEEIPFLDFSPLQNSLSRLGDRIEKLESLSPESLPVEKQKALNAALQGTEQVLTDMTGLPRRPWFRHRLYAPGFYTGYGVKTLPGVREAVEQENWKEAQEQIGKLTETLENMVQQVEKLTSLSR